MTDTVIVPQRKPAEVQHPIHDLISERWSPRAFLAQAVARQDLHSLFEAARWAASTANMQPWSFIIATKEHPEEYARFLSVLNESNAIWAQNAPVLILAVAKLYEFPGKERLSLFDLGMATANLLIQATALGLVAHPMGGFDGAKAREVLAIPAGYEPVAAIALGYADAAETLSEVLRERERAPRVRKPLNEFVFEGSWGQSAQAEI